MKTIYNTYVKMKSQKQCDKMKQLCIDYNLPIWKDECAFKYEGDEKINIFCFDDIDEPEFMVFISEFKNKTEISEGEFIKLLNDRIKQTTLRNLLTDTRLTYQDFADRINVKKSTFENQLLRLEHKHLYYTFIYKDKFPEVKKIYGTDKDAMIKFLKES